jgi:hypothetical protein
MMSIVFWDVRPRSLAESNRRLGGTHRRTALCFLRDCCCAYIFTISTEAIRSFETSVNLYQTIRNYIPEYSKFTLQVFSDFR